MFLLWTLMFDAKQTNKQTHAQANYSSFALIHTLKDKYALLLLILIELTLKIKQLRKFSLKLFFPSSKLLNPGLNCLSIFPKSRSICQKTTFLASKHKQN